jgi:nitrite reductase/ring-hydroxylating ferredoxin subunit
MPDFVKVAKLSEVPPGRCKSVEVDGDRIAIFNVGGQVYALQDSCSHLGAPLSSGYLGRDSVSCEWHGATFDLKTGEALSAPAKEAVPVYTVRVSGDDIELLI